MAILIAIVLEYVHVYVHVRLLQFVLEYVHTVYSCIAIHVYCNILLVLLLLLLLLLLLQGLIKNTLALGCCCGLWMKHVPVLVATRIQQQADDIGRKMKCTLAIITIVLFISVVSDASCSLYIMRGGHERNHPRRIAIRAILYTCIANTQAQCTYTGLQ